MRACLTGRLQSPFLCSLFFLAIAMYVAAHVMDKIERVRDGNKYLLSHHPFRKSDFSDFDIRPPSFHPSLLSPSFSQTVMSPFYFHSIVMSPGRSGLRSSYIIFIQQHFYYDLFWSSGAIWRPSGCALQLKTSTEFWYKRYNVSHS